MFFTKARLLWPILFVGALLLPAGQMAFHWFRDIPIREHSAAQGPIPEQSVSSFRSRALQRYLEIYVERNIGFRPHMLTLFNEANFWLFPERPNLQYVRNGSMGFYPVDTIMRFNNDIILRERFSPLVTMAARRLSVAQRLLARRGVTLILALPPAKVRIYPEYLDGRYFVLPTVHMADAALSYGALMDQEGVNVLDFQRSMANLKKTGLPLFALTGFHWNYYAGCIAADAILQRASSVADRSLPAVDCSDTAMQPARGADTDVAAMMNIFSTAKLASQTPTPLTIRGKSQRGTVPPKTLIIGDSYSEQVLHSMLYAVGPNNLLFYDYFRVRRDYAADLSIKSITPLEPVSGLAELLAQDVVVIVESDGNLRRDNPDAAEFGVTSRLLAELLPTVSSQAPLTAATPNAFIDGWAVGDTGAVATGARASFALRTDPVGNGLKVKVFWRKADRGGARPYRIDVAANGTSVAAFPSDGMQVEELPLEFIVPVRIHDPKMTEVTLATDSEQSLNLVVERIEVQGF